MFDFIDNRKALESVFSGKQPDIKEIILIEFSFDFQYSIIRFKFDIQDYPSNPPVKWKKFNRV